jgi:glutamine synthetase
VIKADKPNSTRLEYRAPDSAANPYLAFAVMLAAGMAGIEGNYDLPPEAEGNLFSLDSFELTTRGIAPLPSNLNDAVDAMEGSDLVRNTMGEHLFEWFIRNKRAEWAEYKSEITSFELERYLPRL